MPEKRRKFDREFREGAVRLVIETSKLGFNEGTLVNRVVLDWQARAETGV